MATPDVPEQDQLTEAVIRRLGEGAGTRNGAAAIVKPVSGDVPTGNLDHEGPPFIEISMRVALETVYLGRAGGLHEGNDISRNARALHPTRPRIAETDEDHREAPTAGCRTHAGQS